MYASKQTLLAEYPVLRKRIYNGFSQYLICGYVTGHVVEPVIFSDHSDVVSQVKVLGRWNAGRIKRDLISPVIARID